jgi:hypothetical protein
VAGLLGTALHVLYRAFDLSTLSYRTSVPDGRGGGGRGGRGRDLGPPAGQPAVRSSARPVPILGSAPLLTIGAANSLVGDGEGRDPGPVGGWAGGLNRGARALAHFTALDRSRLLPQHQDLHA